MTLSEAIYIIEKSQDSITDKVFRGEPPCPPDEYFIAVGRFLPMLKCLNCLFGWSFNTSSASFVPRCKDRDNPPPLQHDADELPFG